jgi:hypothetical protein
VAAAGDRHGFEVEPALAKKLRNVIARLGQLIRRWNPRPEDQNTVQELHQKIEAKIATLPTLYPPELSKIDEDCRAREWALATLYPPDFRAGESTFEDFEEFVEVPSFFTGNPNYL